MLVIYESVSWQNPFRRGRMFKSKHGTHLLQIRENIKHASSAELSPALGQNVALTQPVSHWIIIYYETAMCGILIEHREWITVYFNNCAEERHRGIITEQSLINHGTSFNFYLFLISVLVLHVSQSVIFPGNFPRRVNKRKKKSLEHPWQSIQMSISLPCALASNTQNVQYLIF